VKSFCDQARSSGCKDLVDGYECECTPGWTGINCTDNMDDCIPNPCYHGECIDKLDGYECNCSQGWTGNKCQNLIDLCMDSTCENGGSCFTIFSSTFCRWEIDLFS
jgi:Notch-like protein